jgi:hypothetical protein
MRGKRLVCLFVAVLVVAASVSFAATHKLTRIGVNTFAQIKGNIPTAEVMKAIAKRYAGDIKLGFDQVGMGPIYQPFMDQLNSGTFTEKAIPVGDKFAWMLFRVGGKVKNWEDVEWAGKKPLDVFAMTVKQDTKYYEFVIPKPCGNIALYKTWEEAPKVVIPPATCDLKVSPAKVNINDPVTIDMSGTQNAKTMDVEILTAAGAAFTTHAFTPAAPRWQVKFDKPGEYVIRAKAVNPEGVISANPCQAKVYVNAPPVCKLWTSCLPCEDYVGRPIVFDANGSSDPDGTISKASFQLLDAAGTVIDSFMDTEKPFTWEKVINKAGRYTANVVVYDDMGAPSSNAEACASTFDVTQKKFFFLAEVGGLLAKGTYTGFLFGRLGMMWGLVPDVMDVIIRAGGALPLYGDPWKTFLMADALLNFHLGPAVYVDAGLGYTTKEQDTRKSGIDIIGAFGVNVFNTYRSAGSVFAEIRMPALTSDRTFDLHHKLMLGFRYIF